MTTKTKRRDDHRSETERPDVPALSALVLSIRLLHRERMDYVKPAIMLENYRRAKVASNLGFEANAPEDQREKLRKEATMLIRRVLKGTSDDAVGQRLRGFIVAMEESIGPLREREEELKEEVKALAAKLPVADWVDAQPGFGLGNLGSVIGETGDLSLYSAPGKVWKRMGCAPLDGQAYSTWRMKGGLSDEQWTAAGYSPRRHSVAYMLGDCLMKGNDGPYRQRYDEAKLRAAERHPEWKKARLHKHAITMCAKRALRDLWVQWHRLAIPGV